MSIQSNQFTPIADAGQTVTAGASSTNTTFTAGGNVMKITCATTTSNNGALISIGTEAQSADGGVDLFVGPGETIYHPISADDDNIAYARAGGTNVTLNFIPGYGG